MTFGTGMTSPSGTGTAMPMTGASKDVNDAFVAFFSGETSGGQKILLVQNGEAFADTINAQAESPMAKGTTATVTNVDMDAPGHATVTYTIEMNGQPVLADRIGEAVEQDGQWKVAQGTFCDLLTLEGNPPPVCGQPTTSAATPS
ncbi:hypothetical protein AB4Z09_17695 [Rhodococcus sp. TAF43]|uniref:hypothetical protein n=1 Tax=unclassified Rhodococcus (in: high G+C Gram-positive bacteria) TaxID=192944 RepID=UPI000E0B2467|nr:MULTISPECIES: hypothetical protein [unclassified Rhodococcus (in: high G+C Gram-positive bacteria)]QKT12316.1 hypothetical protein HUN07_17825 [Rhodococcus sp. W8901]